MAPITFKAQSKDETVVYYSQIIGGEKNMSARVSEWPSNEYLKKLTAQELAAYQITSIHWVKGTHFGPAEDYANSLRFSNNLGDESHLYSDKSPDASIPISQRIAKIACRTNYHHVFCFKLYNDFDEVIGKPIYSKYDEKSEEEFTVDIGLDEKLVGFKVWESDWVDCKTSKIAFKIVKTDQYEKDAAFMERVKRYKMISGSKLITDIIYNWHEGGEEAESDSFIEFKKNGTITWKEEEEKGNWHIEDIDTVQATFNGTTFTLKFDAEKLFWVVKEPALTPQPVMKETGAPVGEESWFCIHYADFCFGDKGMEDCDSYVKGMQLVLTKPKDSQVAYQYWVGHVKLLTKPAGLGAIWTNAHTGTGK